MKITARTCPTRSWNTCLRPSIVTSLDGAVQPATTNNCGYLYSHGSAESLAACWSKRSRIDAACMSDRRMQRYSRVVFVRPYMLVCSIPGANCGDICSARFKSIVVHNFKQDYTFQAQTVLLQLRTWQHLRTLSQKCDSRSPPDLPRGVLHILAFACLVAAFLGGKYSFTRFYRRPPMQFSCGFGSRGGWHHCRRL